MSIGVGFGPWGLKLNTSMAGAAELSRFLLSDTFTDANGVLLSAHMPDRYELAPATWGASVPSLVFSAGDLDIQSNRAAGTNAGFGSSRIQFSTADRDTTIYLRTGTAGGLAESYYGIAVRGNSTMTQFIRLMITRVQMTLSVAGGATFAVAGIPTWGSNEDHTLRIVASGNQYNIYWDGTQYINYTDATNTYVATTWFAMGVRFSQLYEGIEVVNV